MSVTRYSKNVAGTPVKSARFTATADNDKLIENADSDMFILGAVFHSVITALNVDAGADISAYPFTLAAGEDLCVTTGGEGDVTIFYIDVPTAGLTTYSI